MSLPHFGEPATRPYTTLGEIFSRAKDRLDAHAWDVLDGGAGEEQTLHDNIAAFGRWSIRPSALSGVTGVDTTTSVLGIQLAFPVLTAPIGGDRLFHERGQYEIVAATARAGIAPVVSEASAFPLERIADASDGPKLMQLHAWGSPEEFVGLADRAKASGYRALCVTIDCPTLGWRERPIVRCFDTQQEMWNANHSDGSAASRLVSGIGSAWTWETLARVRDDVSIPMLVKGVLTAEDADAAITAGVDGVIVSNHGGRQLDCVPASLDQLPEVVAAVRGRVPVLLDGGIRRGTDVLKALALGADVVMVGRLAAMALAADGAEGVYTALRLVASELARSMLLAGRPNVKSIDRSLLQRRDIQDTRGG